MFASKGAAQGPTTHHTVGTFGDFYENSSENVWGSEHTHYMYMWKLPSGSRIPLAYSREDKMFASSAGAQLALLRLAKACLGCAAPQLAKASLRLSLRGQASWAPAEAMTKEQLPTRHREHT